MTPRHSPPQHGFQHRPLRIREATGIHASTLIPKSLAADYFPRFPFSLWTGSWGD
jgi:hypothetical protein